MNKQKHTPGEWCIGSTRNKSEIYATNDNGWKIVALVTTSSRLDSQAVSEEECRANARLIASAPSLLEACKSLFALAVLPSNYTEEQRQELLTVARQAIASAETE